MSEPIETAIVALEIPRATLDSFLFYARMMDQFCEEHLPGDARQFLEGFVSEVMAMVETAAETLIESDC